MFLLQFYSSCVNYIKLCSALQTLLPFHSKWPGQLRIPYNFEQCWLDVILDLLYSLRQRTAHPLHLRDHELGPGPEGVHGQRAEKQELRSFCT